MEPESVFHSDGMEDALGSLFHRLIAADDPLRAEPPIIAQSVARPHLRPLRAILVPGARIEIADGTSRWAGSKLRLHQPRDWAEGGVTAYGRYCCKKIFAHLGSNIHSKSGAHAQR